MSATATKRQPPKGVRREDLKPCAACGKGVLHSRDIAVYRVTVTQYIADRNAINEAAGLEQMLGGNAFLAHHMGTDPELLKGVSEATALFCQPCFLDLHAAEAWESAGKQQADSQ